MPPMVVALWLKKEGFTIIFQENLVCWKKITTEGSRGKRYYLYQRWIITPNHGLSGPIETLEIMICIDVTCRARMDLDNQTVL
mmetsp:Transcript_38258/g.92295  ORF Transcript_38258/g.92295 Transcript_38258/m.92295 type:complete len:83 (-) Transcript_38258:3920-4168(-)